MSVPLTTALLAAGLLIGGPARAEGRGLRGSLSAGVFVPAAGIVGGAVELGFSRVSISVAAGTIPPIRTLGVTGAIRLAGREDGAGWFAEILGGRALIDDVGGQTAAVLGGWRWQRESGVFVAAGGGVFVTKRRDVLPALSLEFGYAFFD